MVDFAKLRTKAKKLAPINPEEIFRRLPKPEGVNDLYSSQAEVLREWFKSRDNVDTVIKLHTGGGKTLVGLLAAYSSLTELKESVIYLAPTTQLVNQTIDKANSFGIPVVSYVKGQGLDDRFLNGEAILVCTYSALFNGKSKFGIYLGSRSPVPCSTIILDDAHSAFTTIRDSYTLTITSKSDVERYKMLVGLFRQSFTEIGRVGTFDDIVKGFSDIVLEVPYWAWKDKSSSVREILSGFAESDFLFEWPLVRDSFEYCHVLISRKAMTVTPILPLVKLLPSFFSAKRKIYMSATIADDSEVIRTFGASKQVVSNVLSTRSLAGVSERMILIPNLMSFTFDSYEASRRLLKTISEKNHGTIVLVPSDEKALKWESVATHPKLTTEVEVYVNKLQRQEVFDPLVLSNRYDGIDLPNNACRFLVMDGLPSSTSDYEMFRSSSVYEGESVSRMLAQRVEQGIGRGARGSGDYCVVLLLGSDLSSWISKKKNFDLLTSATQTQIDVGTTISKEVSSFDEFNETLMKSFNRNSDWIEYHAESLDEGVSEDVDIVVNLNIASVERKAFDLWMDGYHEKAIGKITKYLDLVSEEIDKQTKGWLLQFAARIACHWGNDTLADSLQQSAYAYNRNLIKPKANNHYIPLAPIDSQAQELAKLLESYHYRNGFLQRLNEVVSDLNPSSSSNKFEQALCDLGSVLGFISERHDRDGLGSDVLWLLPNNLGILLEAKSRKKGKNILNKEEHGQLLVAEQWFRQNYPKYECIRVSVYPTNLATKNSSAFNSYSLTFDSLAVMIADAKSLINELVKNQSSGEELLRRVSENLAKSKLNSSELITSYLVNFIEAEDL